MEDEEDYYNLMDDVIVEAEENADYEFFDLAGVMYEIATPIDEVNRLEHEDIIINVIDSDTGEIKTFVAKDRYLTREEKENIVNILDDLLYYKLYSKTSDEENYKRLLNKIKRDVYNSETIEQLLDKFSRYEIFTEPY